MNARWFYYMSFEVLCAIGAIYATTRAVLDIATLHLGWALFWSAVAVGNAWAHGQHRGERRRIEARLDHPGTGGQW